MEKNTLYMVLPCYNEEEVLEEASRQIKEKMLDLMKRELISDKSRVCLVNDGSKDKTWDMIQVLHEECPEIFSGVCLSRNKGHQIAVLAGMLTCKDYSDYVISMDADLQDDINAIDEMVIKYNEGADVVYGVRSARTTDTFFKRFTAEGFYRVMNAMGVESVFNHADFRLMSKRALEGLSQFKEVNLFLRGLVPMVGYTTAIVTYERKERFAGESKYPLRKMISFAWEGITSLSTKPITMISTMGFVVILISIIMIIYALVSFFTGNSVPGWASIMASIWFIGGLLLLSIGIVGQYVGKIYMETKARPRYIIKDFLNKGER